MEIQFQELHLIVPSTSNSAFLDWTPCKLIWKDISLVSCKSLFLFSKEMRIERSGFEPWPGSLRWVLGRDTSLSQANFMLRSNPAMPRTSKECNFCPITAQYGRSVSVLNRQFLCKLCDSSVFVARSISLDPCEQRVVRWKIMERYLPVHGAIRCVMSQDKGALWLIMSRGRFILGALWPQLVGETFRKSGRPVTTDWGVTIGNGWEKSWK